MSLTVYVLDEHGFRPRPYDASCVDQIKNGAVVWFDAVGRSPDVETLLGEHLHVHPLAIEDIFSERITPKVEDYGDYLYVVMQAVHCAPGQTFRTVELDLVIGPNWLFTHRTDELPAVSQLVSDLQRNPKQMQRGPAFVAHALIDRTTDLYLPVVDELEDQIDLLEKDVVEQASRELLGRMFALKRSLQRLRRVSVYQRDMLQRLARGDFQRMPKEVLPFFRDVYDHFVRIADLADSYRELVTSALEMYMSVVANRTNDQMKALAVVATLLMPPTFIAGVYGMNFEHMPELALPWGYPAALALMAVTSGALYLLFRYKRWL